MSKEKEPQKNEIETVPFIYDRNYGFSKCGWKSIKLPESVNFLKNYTSLIRNDKRFRLLTNKLIERFFFFSAIVILIISLSLKEYFFGVLTIGFLCAISYSFGIYKALILRKLRKAYDTRLDGLDFEYFKVDVKNRFGDCNIWIYVFLPIITPRFILNLKINEVYFFKLTQERKKK